MDVLAVAAPVAVLLAGAVVTVAVTGVGRLGLGRWVSRRVGRDRGRDSGATSLPVAQQTRAAALPPALVGVLDVLPLAVLVIDADGTVLRSNVAARALETYRGGRLTSRQLRLLVAEATSAGAPRDADVELRHGPFGSEVLAVHARAAPVPGTATCLLVLEDRTEARRVETLRRDFVANVSHELKTPVVGLALLAEAIADGADDPAAVRRFARGMKRESTRLARLVHDLLELSRLEGGQPRREPETVPLDHVVREAVDRCRLAADARSISLVTGGECGLTVCGDERQLVTALGNLVENAVAYSPDGSKVAVVTRRADDAVEVSVTDQGVGIPEAELERIFERFYRLDPARSRATGGTGLGLAIAKHVAANHGGQIRVWSVEGSGSTFTLRLPGSSAEADLAPVPLGAQAKPPTAHRAPEEAVR